MFFAGNNLFRGEESSDDQSLPVHGRRILLVDDEVLVASLTAEMLDDMGFQVRVENDSASALETFKNRPDDFDLIITDQSMPVLTGADLIAEIRKVKSDIPIILCTGFIGDLKDQDMVDLKIAAMCQKPFAFDLLLQAVDQALTAVEMKTSKL